jgi:lactoylglutathione lyase
MITHVHVVGIFVKDQARALEFYTNVLGFEVLANEPMGPDARWIEVAPPGAQTRLSLFAGMEERVGQSGSIVFKCDDIQATFQKLRQRGVNFAQEPVDQPGGVMGVFTDPDGNQFVLRG